MTQEEKQLLLQDLCARLPYGVKIKLGDYDYQVCGYNSEKEMPVKIWYYYDSNLTLKSYIDVYLEDYRPYLRPMSSMTDEEKEEMIKNFWGSHTAKDTFEELSWYLSKHFDVNGLIIKGLAIEASKGMYD